MKWPTGRTLGGICKTEGHKDMSEHGTLEYLIQSEHQHRMYNGPSNNLSLIVRGPWLRGPFYRWKHHCPPDLATSGSPSSPYGPLKEVCNELLGT